MTLNDMQVVWDQAIPYTDYLEEVEKNKGLWEGVYKTTVVPGWATDEACQRAASVRLLVIVEDWCGDASNTVPVLAKLGDEADCLEMRVLKRDEHPDVMDRYLTNGSRSIPIVVALDESFHEVGHWGPRPSELQQWVMDNKDTMPKDELYPKVRRWYAKDKGRTTLREVLDLLG